MKIISVMQQQERLHLYMCGYAAAKTAGVTAFYVN